MAGRTDDGWIIPVSECELFSLAEAVRNQPRVAVGLSARWQDEHSSLKQRGVSQNAGAHWVGPRRFCPPETRRGRSWEGWDQERARRAR